MTEPVPGLDDFIKKLDQIDTLYQPFGARAVAISLEAIYGIVSPYPPQPDRMRSGHLNTYVRGEGTYPASAFVQDSSEPGGLKIKGKAKLQKTGQVKLTSQQMSKKFKTKVISGKNEIIGNLHNSATYSGWVIGPKDGDPHQVAFHAETGWVNTDDAIEQAMPTVEAALLESVEGLLGVLRGA